MAAKRKTDPFVRCFEVSQPRLHEKGHTIYKVTLKTIKIDALDEDVVETVLWKRFNDFKKLYNAMFTLHKALHRQEEFPPFARSKVFGRFDEQVIIERQQSGQDLLNFVGQRHYLVNSPAFKLFLEGGELVTVNPHSDPVLEPLRLGREDSASLGSDSDLSSVTSSTDHVGHDTHRLHEPMEPLSRDDVAAHDLGGVWQYRQAADNISLDDEDLPDDQSAVGTAPLSDADMALFDPVGLSGVGPDPDPASAASYSNLWLLSALSEFNADTASTCHPASGTGDRPDPVVGPGDTDTDAMGKGVSKDLNTTEGIAPLETVSQTVASSLPPGAPTLSSLPSLPDLSDLPEPPLGAPVDEPADGEGEEEESGPYKAFNSRNVSCGHGDVHFSLTSDVKADSSTTPDSPSPPADKPNPNPPAATAPASEAGPSASSETAPAPTPASRKAAGGKAVSGAASTGSSPQRQLVTVELGEKGKYIVDAARQISLAQQCEANGNYHMAFTYYKSCVGVLLTGVQGDDNSGRREVVRRKTARYLMKAEEIYNKHLVSKGPPDDNRWDTGQSPTRDLTLELEPHVAFLQGALSEVAHFRVLGVIDRVLLVLDQSNKVTYVMKVLHKNVAARPAPNLVPCLCAYMVRLHRFYETDTALYLLLQHATGGKLWNYVSGFLNQQQEQLADEVFPPADIYSRPTGNVYTGQYLHKSPTVKQLAPCSPGTGNGPGGSAPTGDSPGVGDTGGCWEVNGKEKGGKRGEGEGVEGGEVRGLAAPGSNSNPMAPGEAAVRVQNDTEMLMGGTVHHGNGLACEGMLSVQQSDEIISPDWRKAGDGDNRRESDLLSLENSHDAFTFQRATRGESISKTCSALSEAGGADGAMSVQKDYKNDSMDKFEELLKEAHRPSLENFSINSFDSDSAPGSRFDSTASDYNIESIPEVSETSPAHSDKLVVGPSPTSEEVFLVAGDGGPDLVTVLECKTHHDSGKGKEQLAQGKLKPLLNATDSDIKKNPVVDNLPVASTPIKKKNVMDSPPEVLTETRRNPILGLDIIPKDPDSVSVVSFNEPSIYDKVEVVADPDSEPSRQVGTKPVASEQDGEPGEQQQRPNLPDPRSPTEERSVFPPQQAGYATAKCLECNNESIHNSQNSANSRKGLLLQSPTSGSDKCPPCLGSPTKAAGPEQKRPPPLLRRISGERSLESARRAQKRTLSGVFGELDLAEDGEKAKVHLPEGCVRQWAAEMVTAIASLHNLGIICKDLRPDNILLGDRGHILLTYFSQWNCIQDNVDPAAISGLYSAPEVSGVFEVTLACDWWSLGVLLFELFTGKSLVSCHPGGITSHTTLVVPEHVSPEAQSLLYELLRFYPAERLGAGINGADDIRHHPFFSEVTWAQLRG